ncbi:MAG: putative cysteine desulfurase [Rhodospirillaceae bacterium]|nr:MAG: putative cysteine desulfurase [Rhodospirillaceae bacterium]
MTAEPKKQAINPFDADAIRREFPILSTKVHGKPLVYLDSAASAQKPQCVLDALSSAYSETYANVHRGLHYLSEASTDAYEAVRGKVASLINATDPAEVVFTSGATMSLNLIAHAYGNTYLSEGDEVLITVAEHHANIVPWHLLGDRVGSATIAAPVNEDGSFDLDIFKSYITERTKIIAIPHVSNVLGTVFPVSEIAALAHENGAICVVDGCQGVTHMPVDVNELGCDFYVFSGHKLYGPSGIGICWGRGDIWAELPPFMGGGDMIDDVETDTSTYAQPPHRFEAGTPPIAETIGLGAAIDFVQSIGMEALRDHEMDLLRYGHQRLAAVEGLNFIGQAVGKSGVISFTLDEVHPHDISTLIDQDGVAIRAGHHCAQPLMKFYGLSSTARASVAVYNQRSDFDQLAESLEKVNRIFKG